MINRSATNQEVDGLIVSMREGFLAAQSDTIFRMRREASFNRFQFEIVDDYIACSEYEADGLLRIHEMAQ